MWPVFLAIAITCACRLARRPFGRLPASPIGRSKKRPGSATTFGLNSLKCGAHSCCCIDHRFRRVIPESFGRRVSAHPLVPAPDRGRGQAPAGTQAFCESLVYPTSVASLMTKSGKPDLVRGNERMVQFPRSAGRADGDGWSEEDLITCNGLPSRAAVAKSTRHSPNPAPFVHSTEGRAGAWPT